MSIGQGVDPWHLWGGSAVLQLDGVALVSSSTSQQQLAHIQYKRPDTWEFFFVCAVTNILANSPVVVAVDFDLNFGVGRSNSTISPFVRFEFAPAELVTGAAPSRFCSQVQATAPSATFFPSNAFNIIDHIPAQSIQLSARAFSEGSINLGNQIQLNVAAYFAPRSHIRPDWQHGHFGTELNGR